MNTFIKKYISYTKKCIGSEKFRHYFVIKNNKKIDILDNGKLSCAKFVSEVLLKFKLIKQAHVNVLSAVGDMKNSGWKKKDVNDLEIGDVIVWKKNKSGHYHIGFYMGGNRAISNSERFRSPKEHHFTYNGKRSIKLVLEYRP